MRSDHARNYLCDGPFDLALTAAPVAWGKGRWPNVDWIGGELLWAGWEEDELAVRRVRQCAAGEPVAIEGSSRPDLDLTWLEAVLGFSQQMPSFTDPVVASLAAAMPGLRPFANGSLFDGVIGSIVGQSITVAAAATTERRLAALVHDGLCIKDRQFFPAPRASDLARLTAADVRPTGVTWRRAEAIVAIARIALEGRFPCEPARASDPSQTRQLLRSLPLVGPWTAGSALLWGLGMPDIYPSGDVALLRAAKQAYSQTNLTMKDLDILSTLWAPWRGWASRLLWTHLLGPAPSTGHLTDCEA